VFNPKHVAESTHDNKSWFRLMIELFFVYRRTDSCTRWCIMFPKYLLVRVRRQQCVT